MKKLCFFYLIILAFSNIQASEHKRQTVEQVDNHNDITENVESFTKNENDLDYKFKVDNSLTKSKEPSKTDDEVIPREEEAINIDGLSVSQMKELRDKTEKFQFKTEVDRMMKLIINSLYKNKEIFLRELISNASDALDKIRFIALVNQDKDHDNDDLFIRIKADKETKSIHIQDTGIGMTKNELINNLGTIAKSGTSDFIAKLSESKNNAELNDLIGQFGVGFYSSFLVAEKVTVISKSSRDHQYIWESDSRSYSITKDPRGNTLGRGTEVVLTLKEEVFEYLEIDILNNLIQKYSQFINFPIYLWKSSLKTINDIDSVPAVSKTEDEDDSNIQDEDVRKPVEKTVWDWEIINKSKPIWTRKATDITDEEYNEFFKSFSKEQEDPVAKIHFTAEGEVTFKAILYVPKTAGVNVKNNSNKKNDNIKLYVKRVFITKDLDDLMPTYLSFIKGVIDSDDLPLNVSRETLQQNKLIKVIKKKLVRKTLDMLKKMPENMFKEFWNEYSATIKSGVIEDVSNRNRLAKLILFWSSYSDEHLTSLSDYVSRMKSNQKDILFMAGTSLEDIKRSPMVETLLKNQYEVLFLIDPIDEYTLQSIPEFEGKKFQNVAKEGFKIDNLNENFERNREKMTKYYEKLSNWFKTDVLKDYIEKVEISERLTNSPCVLIATTYGWSGNMERIMKAQAYQKSETIEEYRNSQKKILEINPHHPLIRQLKYSLENNDINETRSLATLLYDTALLRSGFNLENVANFSKQVDEIIRKSMKIPLDEQIIEDEEILENIPLEGKTSNFDSKINSIEENEIFSISLSTFRKLLQIEDDDELEGEADENENDEVEDSEIENNGEEEEEGTEIIYSDSEEQIPEENSSDDENESEENSNPEENEDEESQPEENEDEEYANEDSESYEENKKENHLKNEKIYKKRKLHSISENHIYKPTPNDHDCDGIPDDEDKDVDNDGLLDHTQDSDWDGELNHVDEDDDNDGIPDKDDPDSNGDGVPDCREDSSDNKLKLRFKSKKKRLDTDLDGVPDDSDIDDDEDGIPDILEDSDGNDIPDFLDQNKDINDKNDFAAILAAAALNDHDCDGIPDQYDPDDDNDGYFDKKQDSDNDGVLNEYDDDDDNDGIPDSQDPDSNGDGIIDCILKDSDGDGIPDHIDIDDDNDGLPDLQDPNHHLFNFFMDSDKDGIPDSMDKDDDNDGIPDHRDYDSDGDGESDLFPDKDKDGVPDNIDNDMNNDGIPDHLQDRDCDGIPDLIDPDDDNDGYFDNKQDSDNDGILNEWDNDDDNDGIPDKSDPDANGDGVIDCRPRDSDGDGIPDHLDPDDDNDGIPDYLDPDSMAFLLYKKTQQMDALPVERIIPTIQRRLMPLYLSLYPTGLVLPDKDDFMEVKASQARQEANVEVDLGDQGDKDCDGIPDDMDLDIDNDGKIDRTQDSDMDGDLNHIDDDDDNDGILDINDPDSNGDGIPDCRRDDFINYKLIKSRSGKIKRVLRIRKQTEEEAKIENQKKSINLKLIRQQALEIGKSGKTYKKITEAPVSKKTKKQKEIKQKTTPAPVPTKAPIKVTKTVKTTVSSKPPETPQPKTEAKLKPTSKKVKIVNEEKISTRTNEVKITKAPVVPTKTVKPKTVVEKKPKKTKKKVPIKKKPVKVVKKVKKPVPSKKSKKILDHDCDGIPDSKDKDADNDGVDDDKQDSDNDGIMDNIDIDDDNDGINDELDDDANGDGILDCKLREKSIKKILKISDKKKENKVKSRKLLSIEENEEVQSDETEMDEENNQEEESSEYEDQNEVVKESLHTVNKEKSKSKIIEQQKNKKYDPSIKIKTMESVVNKNSKSQNIKESPKVQNTPSIDSNKKVVQKINLSQNKVKKAPVEAINEDEVKKSIEKVSKKPKIQNQKVDEDEDGIPDYLEKDSDGDGIPDYKEDEDGDGIPDYLEKDSDGDGIPDYKEDEDGDGIPDYLEKDSDGDGIPDYKEDEDGDGIPDYLEKDSDGDGIPDYKEDEDGDGIPDYLERDSDGDGIPDYKEDEDGDGIPDYLEKDSDGDGIPDYKEDEDGDGIPDYLERDSDGDGIPDYKEDEDGDGIPDYLEKDSDGDGIPDYEEDEDGDGIPDYLEKDSDGDGIPDYKEDEDGDGIPDYLERDSDGDGIPDYKEDEDGDGIPDYLEKDSDGDGIPDYKEDTDGDGIPDYLEKDSDGDGIPDHLEDEDGDGIPDYLEKDSDGDGIPDYKEDTDGDGIPDYLEKDSDGDGIPDHLEDEDGDGIPDILKKNLAKDGKSNLANDKHRNSIPDHSESASDGNRLPDNKQDADGDGIPDYLEKDSDGDGIPDYKEDADGDGIPDYLDKDSDGDGIPDYKEDADGDGIPDYLDKDSDGDGIPDYKEDTDGDGIPDYLEKDSDGDGIPDYKEDEDGDGIPDYLEKDSDGDGIPDHEEDEDGDGIPDYLEKDSDGDGIPDYKEDEDGDGIPDYKTFQKSYDTFTKKNQSTDPFIKDVKIDKAKSKMHCKSKDSCEQISKLKKDEIDEDNLTLPRIIVRKVLRSLENFFGTDD